MKTKVISIANLKGGVGKTTTALSLGAGLARRGNRVLLVDADDNNQSLSGTLSPSAKPGGKTLSNLLLLSSMGEALSHEEVSGAIVHCVEGFDLLPGDHRLAGISSYLSYQTFSGENANDGALMYLRKVIEEVRPYYDHIIIDTGANYNALFLNALAASDEVIIPSQAQKMSDSGTLETLDAVARVKDRTNPSLINRGILITMVDSRTRYSREKAGRIDREFSEMGLFVFKTTIPRAVKAEEYAESGQSTLSDAGKSTAAESSLAFIDEYLSKEVEA